MTNYKILIALVPQFDPYSGGVQMSTYKIANYFSAKGHEVSIFSFRDKGHIEQNFARLFHAKESGVHHNKNNLEQFKKRVDTIMPNIVINQMPYEHEITRVLTECRKKGNYLLLGCLRNTLFSVIKNLDSYRTSVLPIALQSIFNNSIGRSILLQKHKKNHARDLKFILDHYDYFVVFGPPNKKELEYFIGNYKQEKVAYIPNSIPGVLDELPKKEKTILYLSRLDYKQKRADLILPFWKRIMHELPDWRMEIVGGGPALEHIEVQIKNEKLPRIKVLGKQKPDEYYRDAPIYIMTSAFEGFPNTLIEAQSFGSVPVIYDTYPMASWVVNHEKDGFLIEPFDVEKMSRTVLNLARNAKKRQELAQAALNNANRFTIEKVGQQWLDFFNKELQK